MKLLCSVRDRLAEALGPVMLFPAIPAAVRSFSDLALDPGTMVHRHPGDFDLLHIADIDDVSGKVIPVDPPIVLLSGVAWLAAQKPAEASSDGQLSLLKEA